MTESEKRIEKLLSAGTESTGAAVGGVVGALVGGPIGAAAGGVLGVAISKTLAEFSTRALSRREELRVGTTARATLAKIEARLANGDTLRSDGFFDPGKLGRSEAEEIFEATLFKAKLEAEERKLPYFANAFANLAFRADISPATAHFLLKVAEELTYRQLCFLALVASRGSIDVEALRSKHHSIPDLDALRREEMSLHDSDVGTIGLLTGRDAWTDQLSELGQVMAELFALSDFPEDELRALEEVIHACNLTSSKLSS